MKCIAFSLLLFCCVGVLRAQTPRQEQSSQADTDRVVIHTSLVQVDAVVTDKSGRQVTDLRPSDFELVEGGRGRSQFSWMTLDYRLKASRDCGLR